MNAFWRLMGFLKIGRFRDWYRFRYAKLRSRGRIVAAETPYIDPPFKLRMSRDATLTIGRNVHFRPGFSADIEQSGVLEIGDDTAFNVNCWVGVVTRITIGKSCLIGPMVTMTDGNHSFDDVGALIRHQGLETREIHVGDNVWIGAKATVIHDIGDGAVIGANAVVSKPIPANAVAVGVPAQVLRRRGDRDVREVVDANEA